MRKPYKQFQKKFFFFFSFSFLFFLQTSPYYLVIVVDLSFTPFKIEGKKRYNHLGEKMSTTSYRCITPTPPRSPRQSPNFVYQLSLSIIGVFVWLVVGISSLLCVPSFLKRLCPDLYWAATQPVSSPCDYNEVCFVFCFCLYFCFPFSKCFFFFFFFFFEKGKNGRFEFSCCVKSNWRGTSK